MNRPLRRSLGSINGLINSRQYYFRVNLCVRAGEIDLPADITSEKLNLIDGLIRPRIMKLGWPIRRD